MLAMSGVAREVLECNALHAWIEVGHELGGHRAGVCKEARRVVPTFVREHANTVPGMNAKKVTGALSLCEQSSLRAFKLCEQLKSFSFDHLWTDITTRKSRKKMFRYSVFRVSGMNIILNLG